MKCGVNDQATRGRQLTIADQCALGAMIYKGANVNKGGCHA